MDKKIKITIEQMDKKKKASKKTGVKKETKREVLTETKHKGVLKNNKQPFYDTGMQGKKVKVLKKDNAGKILVGLCAISLVLVMAVVGQFFVLESKDPTNVIRSGTVINGINVGGMEAVDAEQLIYDVFSKKSEDFKLTINYNDKSWVYTKEDFKVNSEIHTIIEEAQKRNEIVDDYAKQTKVLNQMTEQGASVNVAFNYIFVGLDEKIEQIVKEIEYAPVDSVLTFNANHKNCFNVSEHKMGLRVNKEELYYNINEQFNKSNNIVVKLPTIEVEPETTKEENLEQTSLVSTYTTYVADSTGNRKRNVKLAIEKFNGVVVEPGQEVSFNKITGPHSLENGYKVATVIYNGRFVDGVGGGVCQASTTLYNALLLADVEILEVHKHTLPVKYVPLGLDAMVSEYVADLKFKNNSETPIYIQTMCDSESVKVNIYGKALTYQVKTKSETLNTLKHTGDKVVADTNKEYTDKVLFKGETYRLTYPRDGYEAKAFVQYYVDGRLTEQKEIRHEYYNPQNGIIIEGVEEVPSGMNAIQNNEYSQNMNNQNVDNLVPTGLCP